MMGRRFSMKKFLLRLSVGLIALIGITLALLWTPDTDRAAMIAKYGGTDAHFVTDADGMNIHYRDQGNVDGPVLVLIHGSNTSLQSWDLLVPELKTDYRLILLDLPGHGLTGPDPKRDYSARSLSDAVLRVMDEVGVKRAVLVGHSMGGWVAWRTALSDPQRVSGLVLIDASGPVTDEAVKPYLAARLAKSKIGQIFLKHITPKSVIKKTLEQIIYDDSLINDELINRYWELTRFPGNRAGMIDRANTDREPEMWEQAGNISVPTLVLWGEEDVTVPIFFGRAFDERIPRSQLIIYPHAAHMPLLDVPKLLSRDIKIWTAAEFPSP
jgi:pimeloyl-ACP methyl ester carboxylesterase